MKDYLAASRVLFILGAGASVPLGMPTTKSLVEALCDSTSEGSLAAEIRQSAAYRFRVPEDAVNIEDLLEHLYELQTLLWLAQHSSLPQLLPSLTANSPVLGSADERLGSLQRCVYELLHHRCGDCSGIDVDNLWKPVLDCVSSLQPIVPIFTLNYDWTFEKLAIERISRYELVDGFELLGGEWDAHRFASARRTPGKVTMALFKLHGSTNWLLGGTLKSLGSFQGGVEVVYPAHEHECSFGDESYGLSNEMWSEHEPYKTLHEYFRNLTRRVSLIVVIGYSFHDDRVNSEVVEAVNNNARLKVLVVDPGVQGLAPGGLDLVAPFQRLTYGATLECEWSRFSWLEGRFGDQPVTRELLGTISAVAPKPSP